MSAPTLRIRLFSFMTLVILVLSVTLTGCGSTTSSAEATSSSPESSQAAISQTFTLEELAAFDGQDGRKAYIAVDGIVYDVTLLAEWGNKMHAGKFPAGKDYSEELKNAPHGVDKLLKAVQVGTLSK